MCNKCFSIFLEVLAVVFLLLSFYPIMRYGTLAGIQVPQHYTNGCVDIWSTRVIFIYIALIGIVIYALLSVYQAYPNMVNIPFSSKMSVQDKKLLAKSIARFLKVWCMAMFAFVSVSSYRVALGKETCLNNTIVYIIVLCAIIHLAFILLLRKN